MARLLSSEMGAFFSNTRKASTTATSAKIRNASKWARVEACCSRRFSSDYRASRCEAAESPFYLQGAWLDLPEVGICCWIQPIEILVQPQRLEYLAALDEVMTDVDARPCRVQLEFTVVGQLSTASCL